MPSGQRCDSSLKIGDRGAAKGARIFVSNKTQRSQLCPQAKGWRLCKLQRPLAAQTALAYIEQLNKAKVFPALIVTQVVPLRGFYPAEAYHRNFLARHPDHPYIVSFDLPKLRELQKQFPALYNP